MFFRAAGYSYHWYYKYLILQKIDGAFQPGDPALQIAGVSSSGGQPDTEHWVVRDEQKLLDQIVSGQAKRHYYLVVGEKGTGKTSMLLNAMGKVNGDRVAVVEAHADLEIFRIRLGKALDFEFHEESVSVSVFFFSLAVNISDLAVIAILVACLASKVLVTPRHYSTSRGP